MAEWGQGSFSQEKTIKGVTLRKPGSRLWVSGGEGQTPGLQGRKCVREGGGWQGEYMPSLGKWPWPNSLESSKTMRGKGSYQVSPDQN